MSNKPTIEEIQKIREEQNLDLFEALVFFARNLPDYRQYEGPEKRWVIDTITSRIEDEAKEERRKARIRQLLEMGVELKNIPAIIKQEKKEGKL